MVSCYGDMLWSLVPYRQVKNAIDVAEIFAKITGNFIGLKLSETPLFITSNYLGFSNSISTVDHVAVSRTSVKSQEVYQYLDEHKFKITQDDLDHLKMVNDFRAWENEKAYELGAIWRFSAHQFRRSLAFYVSQSALVALPSLKRQLKHISREKSRNGFTELITAIEQASEKNVSAVGKLKDKFVSEKAKKSNYRALYHQALNRELMLIERLASLEKRLLKYDNVISIV